MNHPDPSAKSRVAAISVFASAGMATAKFVVGIAIGSLALISEALHSSVDVVASMVRFRGRGNSHGEEKRPVPGQPNAKGGQPVAPGDDFNHSGDEVPF